jgi:hypothetical protein
MPPVRITSVWPSAMRANGAAAMRIVRRLSGVAKRALRYAKNATISSITTIMMWRIRKSPIRVPQRRESCVDTTSAVVVLMRSAPR